MSLPDHMGKLWMGFLLCCLVSPGSFGQSPKREFRGVWIATVMNIDWPQAGGDDPEAQKQQFNNILDFYAELNFNAVIVQVRPAGDVFYPSQYEPWSRYLTGREGKRPEPYYDPLEFMIKAAHDRGLEFHAWFNPYRATMNEDTASLAIDHALKKHPDWILKYGKRYYFKPGLPEVRQYVTSVVMEVVNRYDIDAVHFDDYFYPYKIKGEVFRDSLTFAQYGSGFSDIEDWRRANVDSLIKQISDSIGLVKPYVKFGISPFGVWRNADQDPAGSKTTAGQTNYDDLYANPLTWLKEGWIDYLVPQIYWSMGFAAADYEVLVPWWAEHAYRKGLYIGQGAYKVDNNQDVHWEQPCQLIDQVRFNRKFSPVGGSVYFSARSLINNPLKVVNRLKKNVYAHPAIVPQYEGAEEGLPAPTLIDFGHKKGRVVMKWKITDASDAEIRYFLLYRVGKAEKMDISNAETMVKKIPYPEESGLIEVSVKQPLWSRHKYALTAVSAGHTESNASDPVRLKRGLFGIKKLPDLIDR